MTVKVISYQEAAVQDIQSAAEAAETTVALGVSVEYYTRRLKEVIGLDGADEKVRALFGELEDANRRLNVAALAASLHATRAVNSLRDIEREAQY